jgi:CDP-paratose 2-epimerase
MRQILITGGAGFVGSNLALDLKRNNPFWNITALDNLHRPGSYVNLNRLEAGGVRFVHGDVRVIDDVRKGGPFDLLIECSAEASVLAGYDRSPAYVWQTNLTGTLNCLEMCVKHKADVLFLSTSRVYPIGAINALTYREKETRLVLDPEENAPGVSETGFSEEFSLAGSRSLYGATKLCSELMIQEYLAAYGLRGISLRCGVLTGPWQMGTVEQGFVALWVARHLWGGELSYIGYGGNGKQVRDILHVNDLYALLRILMGRMEDLTGSVFNVGGGHDLSISLFELTRVCRQITGREIPVGSSPVTRTGDVCYYVSDNRKIQDTTGWLPENSVEAIVSHIHLWLLENEALVRPFFDKNNS